jgi:hypothetical protein
MKPEQASKTIRGIKRCFVQFDYVRAIHERLRDLIKSECGVDEPDMVFIIGDPGVGKSRLLQRFMDDFPRVDHDTWTEVPVLHVLVPAKCSLSRLPGAMLQALGSPLWNKGNEEARTFQLETLLQKCRVRLVILVEVNHLIDRGRERSHYLLADWIKLLSERTRIPFALAGIDRATVLLRVNEQLADRVREIIRIEPFGVGEDCSNQMAEALAAFDGLLGGIRRISLTTDSTARMFAFATAGRLRKLRQMLVRSVEIASTMDEPRIDLGVLAAAFRTAVFKDAPDSRNPFLTAKFNGLPLTRPGEPYHPRRQTAEEVDA